jgi:GMP synthase PP-ATPase subunit
LPISVNGKWDFKNLLNIASNLSGYTRLFYDINIQGGGIFDVIIRSINSIDARTATVTDLPYDLLLKISGKISRIPETKRIYIDLTPKPPGTIEYV